MQRYSGLHLFLYLLFFFFCYCFSAWSCPFIFTVTTAFHSASACLHSWRFNILVDWKLCGWKFYAQTVMFVGGLFISFSVSLLLKSYVNICWCVLDLQVGGACVVVALSFFLSVIKGRCQFLVLEMYWLLYWFSHTILSWDFRPITNRSEMGYSPKRKKKKERGKRLWRDQIKSVILFWKGKSV